MDDIKINDELLDLANKNTIQGGTHAKSKINNVNKSRKPDNTIITDADNYIDDMIQSDLKNNTNIPVLSEENGDNRLPDSDTYWVVDPIDGTQNYAYNKIYYGTAVGLVKNNSPFLCSYYVPELDYLYYAKKDEGAYLNDKNLHVSDMDSLNNAYFVTGGYNCSAGFKTISDITGWLERISCAAQGQSYIASGNFDGGLFGYIYPWDFAIGTILVREAGGVVKNIENKSTSWKDLAYGGVAMGNEKIVDLIIDELPNSIIKELNSKPDTN